MKRVQTLLVATIIGMLLLPALLVAQDIQVVDEKTVKVVATGTGQGTKSKKKREAMAFEDAKRKAVLLLVNDMIRASDEKKDFEKVQEKFLADMNDYVMATHYLKKENYDKPIYETNVRLEVTINRDLVQQKLIAMGIISAAADVRRELDRFTVMPYLDLNDSDVEAAKYKDLFYTRVRVFFEDQNIPTVGEDEIAAIEADEEMLSRMKGDDESEEDPALIIARNTPADILIKITARIETGDYRGNATKKVVLTVGAYTVMTGEFIGSGQGMSEPLALSSEGASVGAGIDQAMNEAMTRVMDRLTGFWRDYTKNGRPVKLIFNGFDFADIRWVREALSTLTNDQKRMKSAGDITEYMVWYDGSTEDLMYELYDVLNAHQITLKEDPVMISNSIRFYKQK